MFVVKHKETGTYYKKGFRRYGGKLVDNKQDASIYRTRAGIIASLHVHRKTDRIFTSVNGVQSPIYEKVFDESVWEIVPVSIEEK